MQLLSTAVRRFFKKPRIVSIRSSNPTPGHISGENHGLKEYMYPVFTGVLYTKAKTWEQPKCALTDEQIKKMWYIYAMAVTQPSKRMELKHV